MLAEFEAIKSALAQFDLEHARRVDAATLSALAIRLSRLAERVAGVEPHPM